MRALEGRSHGLGKHTWYARASISVCICLTLREGWGGGGIGHIPRRITQRFHYPHPIPTAPSFQLWILD